MNSLIVDACGRLFRKHLKLRHFKSFSLYEKQESQNALVYNYDVFCKSPMGYCLELNPVKVEAKAFKNVDIKGSSKVNYSLELSGL